MMTVMTILFFSRCPHFSIFCVITVIYSHIYSLMDLLVYDPRLALKTTSDYSFLSTDTRLRFESSLYASWLLRKNYISTIFR